MNDVLWFSRIFMYFLLLFYGSLGFSKMVWNFLWHSKIKSRNLLRLLGVSRILRAPPPYGQRLEAWDLAGWTGEAVVPRSPGVSRAATFSRLSVGTGPSTPLRGTDLLNLRPLFNLRALLAKSVKMQKHILTLLFCQNGPWINKGIMNANVSQRWRCILTRRQRCQGAEDALWHLDKNVPRCRRCIWTPRQSVKVQKMHLQTSANQGLNEGLRFRRP